LFLFPLYFSPKHTDCGSVADRNKIFRSGLILVDIG
jgi:hypothetical protein